VQLGVICPGLQWRTVIDIVTLSSAIEDCLCVFASDRWALVLFLMVILGQRRCEPLQGLLLMIVVVVAVTHLDLKVL
jgi:hypothetical protein